MLWIGGDLAGLPFLAAIFTRMMREDQRHAVAVDAELDALEAASIPETVPESGSPAWWEDHPELAQRWRRQR